ncbi:MAG: ABC-type transport auxiliary lipoprotein family protein [Pseudomonadota bacterium]
MTRGFNHSLLALLALTLVVSACVSVKQNYPEKRYFALNPARPALAPTIDRAAHKTILRIRPLRVSPGYEGRGLVYRTGPMEYSSDFYNEFLISPGLMFTDVFREWLNAAGLFEAVLDAPSQVLPDYILEGAVNCLQGDYRDDKAPQAVLEMQLFLIDASKSRSAIILQKHYRQEINLDNNDPQTLVNGWSRGLTAILADFEESLRRKGL